MAFWLMFVGLPYCVGFFPLALLPGWRSLGVGGVLAIGLCIWLFHDAGQADGPGAAFALAISACFAVGCAAGGAARILALALRRRWPTTVLVILATFLTAPVLVAGLSYAGRLAQQQRFAPPSIACQDGRFPARLGSASLELPLSPSISVGEGQGFAPAYIFAIPEQARRFCARARARSPNLTHVQLRIEPDHTAYLAVTRSRFCSQPLPYPWWRAACPLAAGPTLVDAPTQVQLYWIGHYDIRPMSAFSADALTSFDRRGLHSALSGGVERFEQGRQIYFTRADIPGYLARCYHSQANGADVLYCTAGHRLTGDLGMIYDFRTAEDHFAEASLVIDRMAGADAVSFFPPQGVSPVR